MRSIHMKLSTAIATFCLGNAMVVSAQVSNDDERFLLEEITIIGSKADVSAMSGTADFVSQEDLDRFDQIDLRKVLNQVPGVYIREEDGYGLRPNIGIRGAVAERSQKITIMRDEVLITPAPYSAPAAYYVPNVSRISSVEVLKGPAAVAHGPHTVGGAVNMGSLTIPNDTAGMLDISAGSDGFYKAQASYGGMSGNFGYSVDVLTYGADGFKSVDGSNQSTGFERTDFGMKLLYQRPDLRADHLMTLLVEGGDEDADETYLGLADADFIDDPYRRYAASQLARFQSDHVNALLNYGFSLSESMRSNIKLYWNEFDRSWNKLDGFWAGPTLQKVLQAPQQYQRQYFVLTGQKDSANRDDEILDVTNNDRSYESKGVQWSLTDERELGQVGVSTTVGLRFHQDQVERNHQPRSYLMVNGGMESDNVARGLKTSNKAESEAFAAYIVSRLSFSAISVDLGVRYEDIDGEVSDFLTDTQTARSQALTAPSLSGIWTLNELLSFFGGVYEGFSPAGPGSDAEHEESTNYELGVRFANDRTSASVAGFYSDYGNLIGRCRVSDATCEPGSEFNGGEVEVSGVEVSASHTMALTAQWQLQVAAAYTYTQGEFATTFFSGFPQWGLVKEGDELPYIPESIGNVRASLLASKWRLEGTVDFQSQMREVPGSGTIDKDVHSDGFAVLDLSASYALTDQLTLQALLLNATDEVAITSHRPFGARPNRPRSLIGRIRYEF